MKLTSLLIKLNRVQQAGIVSASQFLASLSCAELGTAQPQPTPDSQELQGVSEWLQKSLSLPLVLENNL